MAEYLQPKVETVIHINGVRFEVKPDGSLEIYADSERFTVMTRAGRAQNPDTGRLHTCIVISPYLAQQTGTVTPASVAPNAAVTIRNSNPLR